MSRRDIVRLSETEIAYASRIARERDGSAKRDGRRGWNHPPDGVATEPLHIIGACGELAASKSLDIVWPATVNTFKRGPDIGHNIQVRTRSKHTYDLVIHKDDNPGAVFVLVTCEALPMFWVRGWIWAWECVQQKWWRSVAKRPPNWYVPASALYPMDTIPDEAVYSPSEV